MSVLAVQAATVIPPELLTRVQQAYDANQMIEAYRLSLDHGPLREWNGPEARILAARLPAISARPSWPMDSFTQPGARLPRM